MKRGIIKVLSDYLKEPNEAKAQFLKDKDYHSLLEKKLEETGSKFIEGAIALLQQDAREPAERLLRKISEDNSLYSSARLKALEVLEKRGAQIESMVKEKLALIEEIANKDDAQKAEELYPTLDGNLTETFALTMARTEALKALEGAARSAVGKPSMKPLRRVGHILASKGKKVIFPEADKQESIIKPLPEEKPISFVSHFDSAGKQLILFTAPIGKTLYLFQAIVDEQKGIEDFMAVEITRKERSSLLKDWQQNPKLIQADDYYSLYLIRKAEELSKEGGTSLPKEYTANKFLLPPLPETYEPLDASKNIGEVAPRANPEEVKNLHKRPDFFWWGPDDDTLKALEQKLAEISSSPLALTESQKKERIEKVLENTVKEYLTKQRADSLFNRWEEAARVFALKNDWEAVRISLSASEELRRYSQSLEQGGEPPLVPLFVLEETKSFVTPILENKDVDEISPRTSEGGIIIP